MSRDIVHTWMAGGVGCRWLGWLSPRWWWKGAARGSLLGYRLRPELEATFEDLAAVLDATVRGLVIMALSMPELACQRTPARPFAAADIAEWSLPALALAGVASAFIEPDPGVIWDQQRVAAVRLALTELALPQR